MAEHSRVRIPAAALGALLVVLASAIFGTVGIVVQAAVATGLALPLLLATRYLATAGTVHTIALARREHKVRRFGRPHLAAFALGLASIGQSGCYFAAMTRIDVALVLALHFTFPAVVLIVEAVIARRTPTVRQSASCVLALMGVALVVLAGGAKGADPIGLLLACGSGVTYAGIVIAWTRVLKSLPSAAATAFQTTGLGLAWLVACAVLGVRFELPGVHAMQWVAAIVVFCSVLPMLLLSAGTARVGSVASSTLATAEPVVGAAMAAVLLHQSPALLAIVGALLIVCGSFVVVAPVPERGLECVRVGAHRAVRPIVRVGRAARRGTGLARRASQARPAGLVRPTRRLARPSGRSAAHPNSLRRLSSRRDGARRAGA